MNVDERMLTYINSLVQEPSAAIRELEEQARRDYVPVIRKEMQSLVRTLLALCRPQEILEVGTAIGFSALFMLECCQNNTHITTIENYEKRIQAAKQNFKRFGQEQAITLLEGDALQILPQLDGGYDFILMDAAKGQYLNFFGDIMRLLRPGGVLISDNALQDGDIVESRFAVARRNRTIHSRMREYLYELSHNEKLATTILPIGDGVTISVKREGM